MKCIRIGICCSQIIFGADPEHSSYRDGKRQEILHALTLAAALPLPV
jgi:hypothetical protein